ncbi:MAG: hypothetical protein ABI398_10290 [Devosia sp.]
MSAPRTPLALSSPIKTDELGMKDGRVLIALLLDHAASHTLRMTKC